MFFSILFRLLWGRQAVPGLWKLHSTDATGPRKIYQQIGQPQKTVFFFYKSLSVYCWETDSNRLSELQACVILKSSTWVWHKRPLQNIATSIYGKRTGYGAMSQLWKAMIGIGIEDGWSESDIRSLYQTLPFTAVERGIPILRFFGGIGTYQVLAIPLKGLTNPFWLLDYLDWQWLYTCTSHRRTGGNAG